MSRKLSPGAIEWLTELRRSRHLDFVGLRNAMGLPIHWQTLKNALAGQPLHEKNYHLIASWVVHHRGAAVLSGKDAAAGERVEVTSGENRE